MYKKTKKKIKNYFKELKTIHTTPHELALGFGVGTIISILPTPGFNLLLAGLAVFLYPKISKLTLFGAFLLWNPLLTPLIYGAALLIGNSIFHGTTTVTFEVGFWPVVYSFARRMLVGLALLGIALAVSGYGIVYYLAKKTERKTK